MDKKDLREAFDAIECPPDLEERTRESVAATGYKRDSKQNRGGGAPLGHNGQRRAAGGAAAAIAAPGRRRITAITVAAVLLITLLVPVVAYFAFNSTGNNESGLRAFSSLSEVRSYVSERRANQNDNWFGWGEVAMDSAETMPPSTPGIAESPGRGSDTEHSTTNVQVEGIAESDVVHTDGDYIYMLSYYSLSVIDIRAGEFKHILDIEYDNFFPSEMYLYEDGNKLVVLGNMYTKYVYQSSYDKGNADIAVDYCCYWYKNTSAVKVYDVGEMLGGNTDPERELIFDNCYLSSSRMINGKLYLIMNAYSYGYNDKSGEQWLPSYTDSRPGETALDASDFYATPDNGRNYNFSVFAGLDVDKDDAAEVKAYFGSVGTLYASARSFYITYNRYQKVTFFGFYKFEYLGIGIMRFGINGIALEYKGLGKVDGYINGQFAMDEHTYSGGAYAGKTFFRVASTGSSNWQSESFITVFDGDMKQVGFIGGIGVGEQIYSVRFQGEQAVVVTFLQIDPLYVIDLADPAAPRIKSELKIPGVSDYLHFLKIKDGYVFAVGRRQAETGAWLDGIKVSLFDITGEVTEEVYYDEVTKTGDSSHSYSEATYNHKAILYFMPGAGGKEIFGIPVNIYDYGYTYNTYYYKSYCDLYYYEIAADGSVTAIAVGYHAEKYSGALNDELDDTYYYYYRDQLRRSVIAGDKLYLVGYGGVERYDLNNLPSSNTAEGEIVTISTKYWER